MQHKHIFCRSALQIPEASDPHTNHWMTQHWIHTNHWMTQHWIHGDTVTHTHLSSSNVMTLSLNSKPQQPLQDDRTTTTLLSSQSNQQWRHNRPISKLHALQHDWCVCITSRRRRMMIWAWHVASGYTRTWRSRTTLIGCGSFRPANQWLVIFLELTPSLQMSISCSTPDSDGVTMR